MNDTITTDIITIDGPPRVPVYLDQVTVIDAPSIVVRDYDYNQGDERRFDREEAIELARLRAIEKGIRQQVRLSGPAISGGDPLWLIQDVR